MAIPLKYNWRNLVVRRNTTILTAFSITLTVAVFVVLMALATGLETSLSTTGHPLNVVIMREGSQAEGFSSVSRDSLQVIKYLDGIAKDNHGEPFVSPEAIVLTNLLRRGQTQGSNVTIRGLSPDGPSLRPDFKMVEGRFFQSGLREVIASRRISERFQNCGLGDRLKLGRGYWTVVGIFDAGTSAYNSEIWTGVDGLMDEFHRDNYNDVFVRVTSAAAVARVKDQVTNDRRLHLKPVAERDYFETQMETATPIRVFGSLIAVLMAIGASFAAMNTMYATVARRTREMGTLRALGFSRASVLLSFMVESVLIAALGGLLGCVLSLGINGVTTGTTNFTSFSEMAFDFHVSPALFLAGMVFAVFMGLVGGFFPAWRASHQSVVNALRAT
ncbi:MAG TPA: FtsX-like permease family protein [Terriglobia bacterium]|nr:FtsX-like permease family protein [Terriglobia bacterium]